MSELFITIISAGGGGSIITLIVTHFLNKKKFDNEVQSGSAEATAKVVELCNDMLKSVDGRVEKLQGKVFSLEDKVTELEKVKIRLEDVIVKLKSVIKSMKPKTCIVEKCIKRQILEDDELDLVVSNNG